jgi:hypothetical protein
MKSESRNRVDIIRNSPAYWMNLEPILENQRKLLVSFSFSPK